MDILSFTPELAEESSLIQMSLGFVILLSLAAMVAIMVRRIRLPYTVALVIVGLALSFVPTPYDYDLSSELILTLLVPPLIFEATLNVGWDHLRENLRPILILAVVGTLLGTIIVGAIISLVAPVLVPDLDLPFAAAFAFGALISATDPVAVIALFRDLGVSKRLAILVEGESLFNDGVAIVLFNFALAAGLATAAGNGESFSVTSGIIDFIRVFFGGLAIGSILGYLVSTTILKNLDDHLIETATTVALAFGSFIVAEQLHVSGLLSVVAAGIFVGNIGLQNTSPTTRITLLNFWQFFSYVVNSLVFLLIGLEADLSQFIPNLPVILVAVVTVLLSRAIVIYSLSWIHSRVDPMQRIQKAYRHVMYWGGLRGAISLALALSLTGAVFGSDAADQLRLMTFGVVLFTLIVQGPTIAPLLQRFGLTAKPKQVQQQQRQQAMLFANRAGERELQRLFRNGLLSVEVYEGMADVYRSQIQHRNQHLRDLLRDYPELEQSMILQARKDLISAERAALRDVATRGLISEELHHDLVREADNRLAALEIIHARMRIEREDV